MQSPMWSAWHWVDGRPFAEWHGKGAWTGLAVKSGHSVEAVTQPWRMELGKFAASNYFRNLYEQIASLFRISLSRALSLCCYSTTLRAV